ncbi:hypothetical protein R3P38DRAFT_3228219 [Favolaschia claudopus]|uniref:Uncharacterized protein n=1 Tax=Favolaschia claudopus TaxID=2862362 RepID=A0AAV9ZRB6_9AGAR
MPHTKKATKKSSAAAEAGRIASAKYYQRNADTIREKRRLQMAEKRAQIKAKRRQSDKPRCRKGKPAPSRPPVTLTTGTTATTSPLRTLAEAEAEASEALAAMARQCVALEEADPDLDSEDSDEEVDAGCRTISEVAGIACHDGSTDVQESEIDAKAPANPSLELFPTSTAEESSLFDTVS